MLVRTYFVHAQHHVDGECLPMVGHYLPSFDFGKDSIDTLYFDGAVSLHRVHFLEVEGDV